jgi:hypothetical protein
MSEQIRDMHRKRDAKRDRPNLDKAKEAAEASRRKRKATAIASASGDLGAIHPKAQSRQLAKE